MLQSVVDNLAPEQPAGPAKQGGYTPRVFAFERPGKKTRQGASEDQSPPPDGAAGAPVPPPASGRGGENPFARPITGMLPKLKPLTGAIARVVNPQAARHPQGAATPPPAAVPPPVAPPSAGPVPPVGPVPPGAPVPLTGPVLPGGPVDPAGTIPVRGTPASGIPEAAANTPGDGTSSPVPLGSIPAPGASAGSDLPRLPGGTEPFPPPPAAGSWTLGIQDDTPKRGRKIALVAAVGVATLIVLYTVTAGLQAGTVASGVHVAGVDIGGLSRDEAVAALDEALAPRAKEPVSLVAGTAESSLDPAEAGLDYDTAATVHDLTGYTLSPSRMWERFSGGGEEDLVLDVDEVKLGATIDGLEESMTVQPSDGAVAFKDGTPQATDAKQGSKVDKEGAQAVITSSWLRADPPYTLPTRDVDPDVTQSDVDAAMNSARTVISAPVTVEVGGQEVELSPADLANFASFRPNAGGLPLTFDGEGLTDEIVERTANLLTIPEDAHFVFQEGRPQVVGGGPGTTLDPKEVGQAVKEASLGDQRVAAVELREQDPENTKEALQDLGVKEIVSEFSTPITADNVRTRNLIRGAEMVTGDLVKPGETFSLVDALSPITIANGYVASGIVSNGRHVEGVGGGLSQMATTSYNAGYFAGFDDVEHRQHSYWFQRYPAGREATIYVGALDMKFKNDTPYGAVLQSFVSNGRLTVRIWSTKYYEVQTSDSGHQNVVGTSTVRSSHPECVDYPGGEDGFTISNYRKVLRDGDVVKDETYTWTYKPDNPVECVSDDEADGEDDGG